MQALKEHGNVATVSIFQILHRMLPSTERDHVVVMAFGPGLTVEHGFLRRAATA